MKFKYILLLLLLVVMTASCTLWPAWYSDIVRNNTTQITINPEGFENSKLVSIDSYSDGSFIACGAALEQGVQDTYDQAGFWVVKISASYEKEWEYLLDSGSALRVIATSDGGAMAAGYDDAGFFAINLSGSGSSNWAFTSSVTISNVGIAESADNEIILAYDSFVRLDSSGNVLTNRVASSGEYIDIANGKTGELSALKFDMDLSKNEYYSLILDTNGNSLRGETLIIDDYSYIHWRSVAALESGIAAYCGEDEYGSGLIVALQDDNTEYWSVDLDFPVSSEYHDYEAVISKDIIVNSDDNFVAVGQLKNKTSLCLYEIDSLGNLQQVIPLSGNSVRTEENYSVCEMKGGGYLIAASTSDAQGLLIEAK